MTSPPPSNGILRGASRKFAAHSGQERGKAIWAGVEGKRRERGQIHGEGRDTFSLTCDGRNPFSIEVFQIQLDSRGAEKSPPSLECLRLSSFCLSPLRPSVFLPALIEKLPSAAAVRAVHVSSARGEAENLKSFLSEVGREGARRLPESGCASKGQTEPSANEDDCRGISSLFFRRRGGVLL